MKRRRRIQRSRALAAALLPFTALSIGLGQASGAPAEQRKATVSAPGSVRIGDAATLRGEFPGAGNAQVSIRHRQAGESNFKRAGTTRTGGAGRWKARVKPRRSGVWRAELVSQPQEDPLSDERAPDSTSDPKVIRVQSITRVQPAKRDVVAGQKFEIRGRVFPEGQRQVVVTLEGKSKRTRTNKGGRYEVDWKVPYAGDYKVKAKAKGNRDATGSKDSGGKLTAYRYALASWYGPGLYGNRTACGQTLSPSTRGVAHKSLPCGTKLSIRYGSKEVDVRVIDRGPYVGDREFDLTQATKNDLGFGSTGQILVNR